VPIVLCCLVKADSATPSFDCFTKWHALAACLWGDFALFLSFFRFSSCGLLLWGSRLFGFNANVCSLFLLCIMLAHRSVLFRDYGYTRFHLALHLFGAPQGRWDLGLDAGTDGAERGSLSWSLPHFSPGEAGAFSLDSRSRCVALRLEPFLDGLRSSAEKENAKRVTYSRRTRGPESRYRTARLFGNLAVPVSEHVG